ncbi:hypothetical protein NFC81_14700 [Salinispirillum sp. LH 10-3-1]|uniref:Response regulatory domain-containing protein n=1 Tax=Salinispirillum sp. LH 10-3-1 TaxID=2952525 RepID=A0AB38YFV3_9GAMM
MQSQNVLLICSQPVVRRQIESALHMGMPNTVIYEATDCEGAERLAESHDIDIMIIALDMGPPPTMEALAILRKLHPQAEMIGLTLDRIDRSQRALLAVLNVRPVHLSRLAATLLQPTSEPTIPAVVLESAERHRPAL